MSIESVMPSFNHLILCCSLLLLLSGFPSIRVFSTESALHIRWPEYWSFSFNITPSNEYSGLISFRIDWCDLLAIQGTLKSLFQHNWKASILWHSAFFMVHLSHPYMTTGKYLSVYGLQSIFHCVLWPLSKELGGAACSFHFTGEKTKAQRDVVTMLSHPATQHSTHSQKPGFLTPSLLPGPLGSLATPRGPGAAWKATHTPVNLPCVFQAVRATVSNAKVPVSAPAVKSRFSSWKPSVSRNAGRVSLQTTLTTNAQVSWRLCCVL